MKTRCPYCDTRYDIDETTLQATDGLARCHRCEGIFNAYEEFLPDLAAQPPDEVPQPVDVDRLATLLRHEPPALDAAAQTAPAPTRGPVAGSAPATWDAAGIDLDAPVARGRGVLRTLGGLLLIVLLAAGALGQLAWQERNWVLAQTAWRPYLERACDRFDCTVPLPRAPGRFEVLQRSLAPLEDPVGALALEVSFRNGAEFAQPLPDVLLSLYDDRQTLLGRRRFAPDDYLGAAVSPEAVAAGEIVTVRLLLEDLGPAASGFELAFR